MDFLKKRFNAVWISAVLILLALILGINQSLSRVSKKITATFYDGIYIASENYSSPSIDAMLDIRADAAYDLQTVSELFEDLNDETAALQKARLALEAAETIAEKCEANAALSQAVDAIYPAILDIPGVTEDDAADADYFVYNLTNAQAVIDASEYNTSVHAYYDVILKAFPLRLFKGLVFVDGPVLFE